MKDPRICIAQSIQEEVLGWKEIEQFKTREIRRSRTFEIKPTFEIPTAEFKSLIVKAVEESGASRSIVGLYDCDPSKNPARFAGSGTLVEVDGRIAVLTARHVLYKKGMEGEQIANLGIALTTRTMSSDGTRFPVGCLRVQEYGVTGLAPPPTSESPAIGLPDVALILPSEEAVKNAMEIAPAAKPHPLVEELCGVEDEDLFTPIDVVFGGRSEDRRTQDDQTYWEQAVIDLDREYERNGYCYISSFRASDRGEAPRDCERSWKGTSGAGWWKLTLTSTGLDKLKNRARLDGRDIKTPRLLGVVFYQERKTPEGATVDSNVTRGEIIAHKLTNRDIKILRDGAAAIRAKEEEAGEPTTASTAEHEPR